MASLTLAEHQALRSRVLTARTVLSSTANAMEDTVVLSAMLATSVNSNLVSATVSASPVRTSPITLTTPTEVCISPSALTSAPVALTLLRSTPTVKMLSTQPSTVSEVPKMAF